MGCQFRPLHVTARRFDSSTWMQMALCFWVTLPRLPNKKKQPERPEKKQQATHNRREQVRTNRGSQGKRRPDRAVLESAQNFFRWHFTWKTYGISIRLRTFLVGTKKRDGRRRN